MVKIERFNYVEERMHTCMQHIKCNKLLKLRCKLFMQHVRFEFRFPSFGSKKLPLESLNALACLNVKQALRNSTLYIYFQTVSQTTFFGQISIWNRNEIRGKKRVIKWYTCTYVFINFPLPNNEQLWLSPVYRFTSHSNFKMIGQFN